MMSKIPAIYGNAGKAAASSRLGQFGRSVRSHPSANWLCVV